MNCKSIVFICTFFLLSIALKATAASPATSVSGVVVFSPDVSAESAAKIGKALLASDSNFVRMTVQGWASSQSEDAHPSRALVFLYKKKNDKFIEGKNLGAALMKKVEAEFHAHVDSYHISDIVVELQ